MILLIVACLIGILIGLHFNVVAVVPATLTVVLVSCIGATANGDTFLAIVLAALLSGVGLQGGYMIGLTARSLLDQWLGRFGTPQSRRV
jgi:membrane protein DedA with SNARE-associated domain